MDSIGFRKCPFTLSDLKIFEGNHVNSSPKRKRDIYYPLLHEDGRSSVQMMTIMDMDSNRLVLDEIVLQDHAYRLENFGEHFFLPQNGKYI